MTKSKRSFAAGCLAVCLAAAPLVAQAANALPPYLGSAELTRANSFNESDVAWAAVAAGSTQPMPLRPLSPTVLLPDGKPFLTWEQPAEHRRTFYVNQKHPKASDSNPGTEARPWKSISRAAAALEPGDRVIVGEGVYREWVRPARGGTGPKAMITYQAAPGAKVVISGSDVLKGPWTPWRLRGQPDSLTVWGIELPTSHFENGHNPFALNNHRDNYLKTSPYVRDAWLKPPFTLAAGLIYQDGKRLKQVAAQRDLALAPGSYWVDPDGEGRRLFVRPFDDKAPKDLLIEATTRPFAFAPKEHGLGFIRLDGFTIEQVGNCWPVPQLGAVSTMQGHHWIIENNTVREINGLGLDYGHVQNFNQRDVPHGTPELGGVGTIVRRNAFYDCGICSMGGLGLIGGLIEDNYTSGCGWQEAENLQETSGIKVHYMKHSLVRRNLVDGTIGAPGMWIDHSNVNTRVTGNIIVGAKSVKGGIVLEATYKPNLIDHNIVWDCEGYSYFQFDSGEAIITNNLFGRGQKQPVHIRKTPTEEGARRRIIDVETQRVSKSENNRVSGNVFYGYGERGSEVPDGMNNSSDYNLYLSPPGETQFDLAAWQQRTGQEAHSKVATALIELSRDTWTITQSAPLPELAGPRHPALTSDLLGAPRPAGESTQAGPFLLEAGRTQIVLPVPAKPKS